jgi:Leucine-rich repeat (LRR) protein
VELTHIGNLIYLNLGENNFSGHIPPAIFCNLSALNYLDLSSNSLDGDIPILADCPLPDLTFLVLWSNNLVGKIPRSLSNSTKLRWLLLESNFLAGELPSSDMFGGMRSLEFLHLSFNNFSSSRNNTDLEPFFSSLTNCTALKVLAVGENDLAGTIPPVIGRLSPALTRFHLEFNSIFGPIPANLSDLTNLITLDLSHNLLNGSIPPGIADMRRLERLYLSYNLLNGSIPPGIAGMRRLKRLYLSNNLLSGEIP